MKNEDFFNSEAYKKANDKALREFELRQLKDEKFVWKVVGLTVVLILALILWNVYAG